MKANSTPQLLPYTYESLSITFISLNPINFDISQATILKEATLSIDSILHTRLFQMHGSTNDTMLL